MTKIYRWVQHHIYHGLFTERFSVMSVDDVWGVETWHMNQSRLDTEPRSATKDRKCKMTEGGGSSQMSMQKRKQLQTTRVRLTF